MNFLLDTNVFSEWTRPRPDPGVVAWLAAADEDRIRLSVITLAELRHGVERLGNGARRVRLEAWLAKELPTRFYSRVLPVDEETADLCGRCLARAQAIGRPANTMDAFIAATALRNNLVLVTRNTDDFEKLGVRLVNPWHEAPPA